MEGGGVARVDGGWKCSELVTVEVEVAELMPTGSARPDGRKGSAEHRSPRAARPKAGGSSSICGGVWERMDAGASRERKKWRLWRG
jgi:hypothetical protein